MSEQTPSLYLIQNGKIKRKSSKCRKPLLIIAAVFGLAAFALGVYFGYFKKGDDKKKPGRNTCLLDHPHGQRHTRPLSVSFDPIVQLIPNPNPK